MKTYVIEAIEGKDCYFPYLHKYIVKANTLEDALQSVVRYLTDLDFTTILDGVKEEIEEEFGSQHDDEFYGCVYKDILERCGCDNIIIRATCDGEKSFDLLIDNPIEIK